MVIDRLIAESAKSRGVPDTLTPNNYHDSFLIPTVLWQARRSYSCIMGLERWSLRDS